MALLAEVSGLGGHLCSLCLSPGATLAEVRSAVERGTGISAQEQQLVHGTQELASDAALRELAAGLGARPLQLLLVRRDPERLRWLKEAAAVPFPAVWLWGQPDARRADREVVFLVVSRTGTALEHASEELRGDPEVVMAAVAQNARALRYASPELQAEPKVLLAAVASSASALQHAPQELLSDRGFMLAAVRQNGRALEYASAALRADRQLVLAAVARDGCALEHVARELQRDAQIVNVAYATWTSRHALMMAGG